MCMCIREGEGGVVSFLFVKILRQGFLKAFLCIFASQLTASKASRALPGAIKTVGDQCKNVLFNFFL